MADLNSSGATFSDTGSTPSPKKKRVFSAGQELTPSEISSLRGESERAFQELERLSEARKSQGPRAAKAASQK
ncbi:MAG: hypothetical protein AB7H70_02655 [Rhodospirillaceae bacterium]